MPDPDPTPTPAPDPTPDPTPDPPAKTFTQAELDKIVQERIARVKTTPPDDYEDLKAAATKLAEIEAANKTELEKATERAAQAEAARDAAIEAAKSTRVRADIVAAAAGKFADTSDAVALIDQKAIEFDKDGSPTNIAALVDGLLEAKPHLAATGTNGSIDQGARKGEGANQISREQLATMSPDEVTKALAEGRLSGVLAGK